MIETGWEKGGTRISDTLQLWLRRRLGIFNPAPP